MCLRQCYITEAVNRLLRPEAADAAGSDPDPFQDSSAKSEPTDGGHTEESAGGGVHHGERPLAPAPLPRSSGVVGWDLGLRPAGKHTQSRTRQREDAESKASEEQETKREEAFGQTESDDGGPATAGKGEEEEEDDRKCEMYIPKQAENEEQAKTRFLTENDAMIEDMKGSRREKANQWPMTPNTDAEKREEVVTEVNVNEEDEHDLEEVDGAMGTYIMTDHEVTVEGKVNKDGAGSQGGDADTRAAYGDVENKASGMSPENDNGSDEADNSKSHVSSFAPLSENDADADVARPVAPGSGRDNDEDEGHVEGVSILQEREQENTTGPAHKHTMAETPEQEDGCRTDTGGSTQRVICSEEVSVNATKDLHTEEEQEDVAAITQTNTSEADCVNAPATHVVEDHGGSEEDDKGGTVEISRAPTSVTVKPEAETPQETSREPENPPLRMCEGRAVVSPGLHSAPHEETQEGVPEYNNEPGPDEDQAFLEAGAGKEIQTTQLPEEVESLQNGGYTSAAEDSAREESREAGLLQARVQPLVEQIIQKSRVLFESEEGNSLLHSMKTGIEDSEKEFEAKAVLADDPTTELHLKTEELSAECEADERLRVSRDAGGDGPVAAGGVFGFTDEASKLPDAELLKTMNPSVLHESWDENSNMIFRLVEDDAKSGFLKESEGEPRTHGDRSEGTGSGPEEGAAQDEMQNKTHGGILDVTAERIKETGKNPADVDDAFEMSIEETLEIAEAADGLILTGLQSKGLEEEMTEAEGSFAEGTGSGHEGAIDEEILDLWIQAVSTEDIDQIKQQTDTNIEQEPPEKQEQLSESHAGEHGLVSDVSPFTAESGFLDRLLEFSGTESFQDNYDVLASESETADMSDWSKPQTVAACQDAAETEESNLKVDKSITGLNSHTEVLSSHAGHREAYKSQGGSDGEDMELMENDTRSQKEADGITDQNNTTAWKDTEEADADLQTNGENAEESEVEIKLYEPELPESGSDLLLEDKITSHTQVGAWAQSETLLELPSSLNVGPGCADESLPEVLEYPVNTFEVLSLKYYI